MKQLINLPRDTFMISHPMCTYLCFCLVRQYVRCTFPKKLSHISGPAAKIFIYLYHFMTIIKSNCTARLCTATNENTDDMLIWIKCFIIWLFVLMFVPLVALLMVKWSNILYMHEFMDLLPCVRYFFVLSFVCCLRSRIRKTKKKRGNIIVSDVLLFSIMLDKSFILLFVHIKKK